MAVTAILEQLHLKRIWRKLTHSIGFIPVIMGLCGVLTAYLLGFLEDWGISRFLNENFESVLIRSAGTATSVMTYLAGGIISIMVFSFSMVMLLLNQASSNFSPRVLPGLISVKKHQYIIGNFLFSLLFITFVAVKIKPNDDTYELPGFSMLVGIVLTVNCLFSFIYFIDSISKAIQIDNILKNIRRLVIQSIKSDSAMRSDHGSFETGPDWKVYASEEFGYYKGINQEAMLNLSKEHHFQIAFLAYQGKYISPGEALFSCSQALEKEVIASVRHNIYINLDPEDVMENYVYGFKQVAEVGVRAMSPGVNDPATAMTTIDYLSEFFCLILPLDTLKFLEKDDYVGVSLHVISFGELLSELMMEYRMYCKGDVIVSQKLVLMLQQISKHPDCTEPHKAILKEELEKLLFDVEKSIENPKDLESIRGIIRLGIH